MIYLDNNATTRVADEVIEAMTPYYREHYGNPHSPHALGRKSQAGIDRARNQVAQLLHATAEEVFFTSCGTESNAIVLRGARIPNRRKIVTTAVEHPSVLALLRMLVENQKIELVIVPVDRGGAIDLEQMRASIDENTSLVSVMLAQNETGVIHPVAEIAKMAHERGAFIHVDAVQAAGKIPIDIHALDADFLSISGHKFHAPKGCGALYVRKGISVEPLWRGGGQENGLRSGTEAVPLIVALGAAAELAAESLPVQRTVANLRDRFESAVRDRLLDVEVNAGRLERLPNTSSLAFPGLEAKRVVFMLDRMDICVSAGSACQSGKAEMSSVIVAMGLPSELAMGTVRFSLSRFTTAEEIEEAAAAVTGVVEKTRLADAPIPVGMIPIA